MFFQRAWVAFSRISSFVFCRWNKVIQVWNDMRVSKQWQNLHFCINCHVNFRMQLIFLKWRHVLHTLYHSHFHPRQLWCYQVHHYQVNDLTNCNKKQWCLPSVRKMGLIRERCRQSFRLVGPGERKGSRETSDHRYTLKVNGSSIDLLHSLLPADIWSLFLFAANN